MNSNISVIMATYNGSRFLEAQLRSILDQELPPAELIVSDDQSTDDTAIILQEYAKKGVLKLYVNPVRKGVIGNFKAAAAQANPTHYVAMADQDDIWLPGKLKLSLAHLQQLEKPGVVSLVYADPQVIDAHDHLIANSLWEILGFNKYNHTLQTVLFGNPSGGCTMLMNAALAGYIKTIPDNSYMHDAWLTLYAYTFGQAAVVPTPVIRYRQHGNNVTFSTNYTPQSRLKRVFSEVTAALKGKTDLFEQQFVFVRQFYAYFYDALNDRQKQVFEDFLSLEKKGYLARKIAFRKAMHLSR